MPNTRRLRSAFDTKLVLPGKAAHRRVEDGARHAHAGDRAQPLLDCMERRSELYIGTLRKFIEAMNGELVLAARFPDGVEVPIKLAEQEEAR